MELKKRSTELNRIEDNAREGQSEREKKSKVREFCREFRDSTKRLTTVLAFAVGMTVLAYGCGGKIENSGDADNTEMVDGENDAVDVPDVDVPDAEMDDADEIGDVVEDDVENNCIGPGIPLEGEVDPLLANSEEGVAELDNSDSEVSGDYEMIVGGEVSGNLLILGECPDDPDSIAAFGAQDGTVNVTPEYRLDFGTTVFTAEMPDVDGDVCSPPEVDDVPVSLLNDEANLAVKKATVGSVNTRGEFGFTTTFEPSILVNGLEADSTIPLDGFGYDVKAIMVSLVNPLFEMSAKVYSNTGEEILSREVEGSIDSISSKILRVYQLGPDDLILPAMNWDTSSVPHLCLRSEDGEPKEITVEITGDVLGAVVDSCGKIFASFDINNVTATIVRLDPIHLAPNYSIVAASGTGVEAMEDGYAAIEVTIRRTATVSDPGEYVMINVRIEGDATSREDNPVIEAVDNIHFTLPIIIISDWDAADYWDECGYFPGGIN